MAIKLAMLDFTTLVTAIRQTHEYMAAQVGRAVNISLTLRNWVIGCYIREYEQNGADRAKYGENLFAKLSQRLKKSASVVYHPRELRRCREFYTAYPQIRGTLSPKFDLIVPDAIRKSLISDSTAVATPTIRGAAPPELQLPPERLVKSLSFSHFVELIAIGDPLKCTFYEIECIRGNWSVRELKRQIASLYYERSGLSKNKEKLAELVRSGAESAEPQMTIRDPYVFEFLGIKSREVMGESGLEDQLLDKLQEFLLEMGRGFCFEARQKRILIGNSHNFVDLVFYHRILKCHVLVELKVDEFTHEHIGQLNTYVSWYKQNEMTIGDNPPVGILLCTQKDQLLVEYALAGIDDQLFVSKYQLELPKKEEMQQFLMQQMREFADANPE